ncbi:MAG: TetR family transcriptional regulator [Bryobacteraceae bacterium]|nr:TetR family transcriptional regulator [Bryobacteraceae bacterium]
MTNTKERILDAAERLIAGHGIGATSLRSVIAAANVNLAAVHYHFGSKEALIGEVVRRRIGPLNRERLALLDRLEREAGRKGPSLEQIVEAFVAPIVRLRNDPDHGDTFTTLIGRLLADPAYFSQWIVPAEMAGLRDRFIGAMERALPGLPKEELLWRLMFSIGAMAHMMRIWDVMPAISGGACGVTDVETNTRRLVAFIAAGLRASAKGGRK